MKITKRKDGRYQCNVYLGTDPINGKRIQKCVSAKTRTECRAKVNELLKNQDDVIRTHDAPKIGLREFSSIWVRDFTGSFRKRSREQAESHIRTHILPYFGDIEITKITPVMVQAFINQMDRSPKTVANVYETFKQIMDTAVSVRYISESPCQGVKLPKKVKPKLNPLDENQIKVFLNHCPDDVFGDLMRLDAITGLRMAEIIAITWDRVDLENRTILIDRTLPSANSHMDFQPTKNGKSRIVPIPESGVKILRRQGLRQKEQRLMNAPYWQDFGLVFSTEIGGKIVPNRLRNHFRKVCDDCGFEGVRFHDLRHTYAVLSLKAGVDYKSLSESLGHYSVAFTMDVYAFVSDQMRKDHADKLENYLSVL